MAYSEATADARRPLLVGDGDFPEPYGSTGAQIITLPDGNILTVPNNEPPNRSDPLPVGEPMSWRDAYGRALTAYPPSSGASGASSAGFSHWTQENIPSKRGSCQLAPEDRGSPVPVHMQQTQPPPMYQQPDPSHYQPSTYQGDGIPQYPRGQYGHAQYPNPATYQDPQYNIHPSQYQPYPPPVTYAQPFQGQVQPPTVPYYPYQNQIVQQQQPIQVQPPPKEHSHTSFDMGTKTLHRNQLFIAIALFIVSIVCMDFCVLPCTIPALVFACKAAMANSKEGQADEPEATRYHKWAKYCNIASIISMVVVAFVVGVGVFITVIAAEVIVASSNSSSYDY